jgi:hypothetical protein
MKVIDSPYKEAVVYRVVDKPNWMVVAYIEIGRFETHEDAEAFAATFSKKEQKDLVLSWETPDYEEFR